MQSNSTLQIPGEVFVHLSSFLPNKVIINLISVCSYLRTIIPVAVTFSGDSKEVAGFLKKIDECVF